MIIELPFPPSLNSYWRHIVIKGRARTLISKPGREWRARVLKIIGTVEKLQGRLRVMVELYPPDRRVRDLDNHIKCLFDAFTHADGVWTDDSQVDELTVFRREVQRGGKCVVTVEVME